MAITLFPSDESCITLREYIETVRDIVSPRDIDSVEASASLLRRLGNNQSFVVEFLNAQLKLWPANALPFYSVQSSILAAEGPFSVRLNIWPTISEEGRMRKTQANLYSYFDTHDHNFTFMTVGYFGPGYGTRIYEYDPEGVVGYIGEKVEIRLLEETTLPVGKVMLYRPSRDIHTQLPPVDFSMSLNLMVSDPQRASLTDQYYFNVESSTISAYVESHSSKRVSQVRMMQFVGDDNSVDILWTLAQEHPCNRTRLTAMQTIIAMKPFETERAWALGISDRSELVRRVARAQLRTLETI